MKLATPVFAGRLAGIGLALGSGLFLWALVGPRTVGSSTAQVARPGGIPGYDYPLRGAGELVAALRGTTANPDVESLTALVHGSLVHGEPPRIRASQNWLAWFAGLLYPDLGLTQDPERLASGGVGLCSDAVIVLLAVAREAGFEAEMIDLGGHLIARLSRGGDEWTVDPDYGFMFEDSLAALTRPSGVARVAAATVAAGHPPDRTADYVRVLSSAEDNRVLPAGVLSPRLRQVERALDVLAWLVPLVLALLSGMALRSSGR